MKCIKNHITGEIKRVSEYDARTHYIPFGWTYIPKAEWKKHVRPKPELMRAGAKAAAEKLMAKIGLRRL